MSEKRLIDLDELMRIAFRAESSHDVAEEFNKLPSPTLPDVCGKRTLDSMTDDEIEELVKLYAGDFIGILLTHRNGDKDIYIEYTDVGQRKALIIYPGELSVGGKEVKIFKWFLEKGFNVFEVGNENNRNE